MANEKVFQSRIQLKHDVEENWSKATNFIPKVGEIIIYDIDENNSIARFKIGDGITNINSLPFISHHEAISYLPQKLTEEQQMQARENLGLYRKSAEYAEVAKYGYYPDFNAEKRIGEITKVIVEIYKTGTYEVETQYHREHIPMAGDSSIHWIGNANLITGIDFIPDETKYTDLPFCWYYLNDELYGAGRKEEFILSEELKNAAYDYRNENSGYFVIIRNLNDQREIYYPIPKEYLPAELNPDILVRSTEQYLESTSQEQVRNNINANIKRLEIYIDKEGIEGSIPTFNRNFYDIFSNISIDETTNTTGCVSPQYDIVLRNFYSDDGLINYSGTEMFVRYEQANSSDNNQYNCLVFEGTCLKTAEKITIRYYENEEIVYNIENIVKAPEELIFNQIAMIDQITGRKYIVEIHNGTLVSFLSTNKIEVTSLPNVTTYNEGDYFNPDGLVISSVYEDGTTREITNYTYSKEYLTINDSTFEILYVENGVTHSVTIELNIVKFDPSVELIDFEYIDNGDGTYTITGWKETLNGEPSTEMVIPDNPLIIL